MDYTLTNFNIPNHLKDDLDVLAKFKRVSKTAIINTLLEEYCRRELRAMTEDRNVSRIAERMTASENQPRQQSEWEPPSLPEILDEPGWGGGYYR